MGERVPLRWKLADEEGGGQSALFDDERLVERLVGTGEFRGLEFFHVNARRIINSVPPVARVPFRHTINAYRGCSHACSYCFARPTHDYLGLDIGTGFDTQIVVKVNAVERLRAELAAKRWSGEAIAMGTNTDPYQRAEGKYHLTQGIVRVLAERHNPFSILTKSTLILRDLDLLKEAAAVADVSTAFSIGTLDPSVWKATEPGTPHPRQRVEAERRLNDAGVGCAVLMAPILPGISDGDDQLEAVVDACVSAGATSISPMVLHLRPGVRDHFMDRLAESHPHLVEDYQRRYANRTYLPKDAQETVTARVRSMVRAAERRHGVRRARRAVRNGAPAEMAPTPAADQLSLL